MQQTHLCHNIKSDTLQLHDCFDSWVKDEQGPRQLKNINSRAVEIERRAVSAPL